MSMSNKNNVHIKGTNEGLVFLLNDDCPFEEVITELKDKLENSHQGILTGPLMRVTIKTGYRILTDLQREQLKDVFRSKGNLMIHAFENHVESLKEKEKSQVQVVYGTIRSGQVYQFDGNILLIGDINPGGSLLAKGDIYVLGNLRGMAHAGIDGDAQTVIAASVMDPTQLRIADIISYPPEKNDKNEKNHKVAYVENKQMVLESLQYLSKIRNGLSIFT